MKYKGFWFCLSVLVVVILATEFSGNAWQSKSAKDKYDALWSRVMQDTSPGSFPSAISLLGLFIESMDLSFDTISDDFPYQGPFGLQRRSKLIHGVGVIAQIKWRSIGTHPYTGLFKGSNYAFARFSWAKSPDFTKPRPYLPGVAFKFLRDGQKSANFMAMTSLLGVDTPNFFAYDVTNHLPDLGESADILTKTLKKTFAKASRWPVLLGLSDVAAYDESGKGGSTVFPFRLIFHPPANVRSLLNTTASPSDLPSFFTSKIQGPINNFYYVYAEAFPGDTNPIKIGAIDLLTITPSKYSDETLFFQHQRIDDDFNVHPEWVSPTDDILTKQRSFDYWVYPNIKDDTK